MQYMYKYFGSMPPVKEEAIVQVRFRPKDGIAQTENPAEDQLFEEYG